MEFVPCCLPAMFSTLQNFCCVYAIRYCNIMLHLHSHTRQYYQMNKRCQFAVTLYCNQNSPQLGAFLRWYRSPPSFLRLTKEGTSARLVFSTSLMASLIRSVGGLLKYVYQALWLVDQNAEVIGQSINRRGVAQEFPHHVSVSSSFSARFLYGFPYRFQRAWTVLCSTKHPLDVVRVGAWNSLVLDAFCLQVARAWAPNLPYL